MLSFIDKKLACAFTGPRPEKLTDDFSKEHLEIAILQAVNDGYKYFLSGMSRGFDLYASEIVLSLSKKYDICLVAIIPFVNQEEKWSEEDKENYKNALEKARYTFVVSDIFFPGVYHLRNKYLVNNASKIITYYKNTSGGTKYTLNYAKTKNVPIENIADIQFKL